MTSRPGLRVAIVGALALLVLIGPTCTQYEEGISVEVHLLHHYGQRQAEVPEVNPAGEPRRFTTDLGYEIELQRGYLAVEQVKLRECDRAGEGSATRTPTLRALASSAIALAHPVGGDPTSLGVPFVEDVLRADFSLAEMGEMQPPPGRYCEAAVVLAPADADALALPSDIDMVGLTLYVEGNYRPSGAAEARHFVIESTDRREVRVSLVDVYGGVPTPFRLDADNREARLALGALYNFWLDGIDLAEASESDKAGQALDNAALTIHHQPGL